MKFNEARRYLIDNLEDMNLVEVIGILSDIREEYAPTVEMTKEQKQLLDSYREPGLFDVDYAFNAFYEDTHAHRLGMREHNLYDNLTEMQLTQAWLYPESIKVKGEKQ